jgi:hypothetical protein
MPKQKPRRRDKEFGFLLEKEDTEKSRDVNQISLRKASRGHWNAANRLNSNDNVTRERS